MELLCYLIDSDFLGNPWDAKKAKQGVEKFGWFDMSTLKEPYRIEGKKTMGYEIAARVGAALNKQNMHAERVDGYNPLAVAEAIERKKAARRARAAACRRRP